MLLSPGQEWSFPLSASSHHKPINAYSSIIKAFSFPLTYTFRCLTEVISMSMFPSLMVFSSHTPPDTHSVAPLLCLVLLRQPHTYLQTPLSRAPLTLLPPRGRTRVLPHGKLTTFEVIQPWIDIQALYRINHSWSVICNRPHNKSH